MIYERLFKDRRIGGISVRSYWDVQTSVICRVKVEASGSRTVHHGHVYDVIIPLKKDNKDAPREPIKTMLFFARPSKPLLRRS